VRQVSHLNLTHHPRPDPHPHPHSNLNPSRNPNSNPSTSPNPIPSPSPCLTLTLGTPRCGEPCGVAAGGGRILTLTLILTLALALTLPPTPPQPQPLAPPLTWRGAHWSWARSRCSRPGASEGKGLHYVPLSEGGGLNWTERILAGPPAQRSVTRRRAERYNE
jgi:hypothetical protein